MPKQILVADDDPHIQDLVQNYLEQEGFDVDIRFDGFSAHQAMLRKKYDLVILDVNMPHTNGLKLLRAMKRDNQLKKIPVIMLTVRDHVDDVEEAARRGVSDYIIKPPKKEFLLDRVKEALSPKSKNEIEFPENFEDAAGQSSVSIFLKKINRQYMILQSDTAYEANDIVSDISIPVLDYIGISQTTFVIANVKKVEDSQYQLKILFKHLGPEDKIKLKNWLSSQKKGGNIKAAS